MHLGYFSNLLLGFFSCWSNAIRQPPSFFTRGCADFNYVNNWYGVWNEKEDERSLEVLWCGRNEYSRKRLGSNSCTWCIVGVFWWNRDLWQQIDSRIQVLFTKEFSERHTADNITACLRQACVEWKIRDDHVMAIVHDNASNMTADVRKLEWKSLPCVAHTLQLSVTEG